ncbi:Protein ASI1 [Colletotrichum plurivorum]|uniref:Protein ASI1 n=1 Tax=Colletotrichum plurivorum TaxID=2175906 RepID=A0A8H6MY39_9PEZI|nr:Protein ASI1 [Colletotrichum plurivorum]
MADPSAPMLLESTRTWYNLSAWTAQLQYAVNITKLAPSFEDLVLAGPRMVRKLTAYLPFPDSLDALGQRIVPEATETGINQAIKTAAFGMHTNPSVGHAHTFGAGHGTGSGPAISMDHSPDVSSPKLGMEGARGLGSVFSYATSKWALCCIAMAVVLNRTHIFAATRRRLRLTLPVRLLMRFFPVLLFLVQARDLLRSIQCQTSPEFAEMRWGNASKSSELMFSQSGGFLHTMSSAFLLGPSDRESCLAIGMVPVDGDVTEELRGSLSLLWPLFGTFCLSQFLETVSCAVQGRPVSAETGMTLFEHSLAFAEADAAISNQLGWGLFTQAQTLEADSHGGSIAISRSMILRRVNTPPEVLLVAFLSTMSHITSHLLGIFNLQARFRLVSTGFWGFCFMSSILWSAFTFSLDDPAKQGLLRFPTVCIIGFIPHVLVLGGILVCLCIYLLALALAALAPTDGPIGQSLNIRGRLAQAHGNMQANLSLSDIRISMEMDFYTALLRTGFGAITMASEAVYLNEDRDINLRPYTWLEEERSRELEDLRMQWVATSVSDSQYDTIGTIGLVPVKDDHQWTTNGYARERAAQKVPKSRSSERRARDGVGAAERSGRWLMALDFLMNVNRLIIRTWATAILKVLQKIGFRPPHFLLWIIRRPKAANETRNARQKDDKNSSDAVSGLSDSSLHIPMNDAVDIEWEFRRQASRENQDWVSVDEADLDSKLYRWWLKGGWWGSTDNSGDYRPKESEEDNDTTSMCSFNGHDDSDWESQSEGQRTPTQFTQRASASREATPAPDMAMQMSDLARLLHPQSPEEREEAYTLAAHFASDGIMTRSRYRRSQQLQRTKILTMSGRTNRVVSRPIKMTADEEAQRLEQLLLSRRSQNRGSAGDQSTWAEGAAGLGPDGPQCVVCQSSPRTIIVWPCRCLSLCDDCRVSLAMNNFDKCVCCRREVISFSRIFVP